MDSLIRKGKDDEVQELQRHQHQLEPRMDSVGAMAGNGGDGGIEVAPAGDDIETLLEKERERHRLRYVLF